MSRLAEKDIIRRAALCKALFLAPPEIYKVVDRFIEICVNTHIEQQTGKRPSKNFPLDFWTEQPIPEDPYKLMDNLTDKDPAARAATCKVLFLVPARFFRDIERYFEMELKDFIEKKTGKKPNSKYPLDFWIKKAPQKEL